MLTTKIKEKTFKQGLDEFIGCAPKGGWSDYWAMQQDWEFYKDSLCRDGVITQKQADSWSTPCTPDTFARWQKRNGLVHRGYESKKNEAYSDYDAIRDWLEGVMGKAGTMFESAYVFENSPGEICAEIEGYDSTGGDALITLVWDAGEDFAETISAMADELVEYAEDFDPEEEAEMYRNSGMAGVPSLRQLLKAMDERKEDMVSLAGAVSLAASKL